MYVDEPADLVGVSEVTHRSLPAWEIKGSKLTLIVSAYGACLSSITDNKDEGVPNPLWQPSWPSCAPHLMAEGTYGGDVEAPALATISGSNLCLDRFGPPREGDKVQVAHGETSQVKFELKGKDKCQVSFVAKLPLTKLAVKRTFSLHGYVIVLRTTVENPKIQQHEVEWAEHTTLGGTFLDGAEFSSGADIALNWPGPPEGFPCSRFKAVEPLGQVDIASALAFPSHSDPPAMDVVAMRAMSGHWKATNRACNRELRVQFSASEFPYLAVWTEHRGRNGAPWKGKERARGMEINTKGFPEGPAPPSRTPRFMDRTSELVLGPHQRRTHTINITYGPIPEKLSNQALEGLMSPTSLTGQSPTASPGSICSPIYSPTPSSGEFGSPAYERNLLDEYTSPESKVAKAATAIPLYPDTLASTASAVPPPFSTGLGRNITLSSTSSSTLTSTAELLARAEASKRELDEAHQGVKSILKDSTKRGEEDSGESPSSTGFR